MDTRNKSGYDDVRAKPPGAGPGPDPAGPLETRLKPGHALCPQTACPRESGGRGDPRFREGRQGAEPGGA